ncbi:MAG: SDR family NAD(P)-dependent oxidoreductase [Candidatus Omnitrophica bacterium]|nr:SDR family NAD(P)-dependent oxidoreductase [Candidatus Omnitrophota bacterium]
MIWAKKKVLITGAGGFVGSHLAEELVKRGAKVKAFVRYNSRNDFGLIEILPPEVKNKIEIIAGDLRDFDAVYDSMQGAEIVFHLGALIAIPYSYLHPKEVIETNVMGTYNILNAAKRLGIKKLIHTSTSEVYGTALTVPIRETHPLQGQSPYSASKIGADKLAESFYKSFGLPIAIIRPFNTFGPRQSGRAIIPTIITQALRGGIIKLGSLTPRRDFTFVRDTVDGFIKVAESNRSIGEVINIGSGSDISIGELAQEIFSLIGKKIRISRETARCRPAGSEVERLLADNTKARELLGWEPRVPLIDGLKITIDWVKNNIKKYKAGLYIV